MTKPLTNKGIQDVLEKVRAFLLCKDCTKELYPCVYHTGSLIEIAQALEQLSAENEELKNSMEIVNKRECDHQNLVNENQKLKADCKKMYECLNRTHRRTCKGMNEEVFDDIDPILDSLPNYSDDFIHLKIKNASPPNYSE